MAKDNLFLKFCQSPCLRNNFIESILSGQTRAMAIVEILLLNNLIYYFYKNETY